MAAPLGLICAVALALGAPPDWPLLVELNRGAEVVRAGLARVSPGGDLSGDGESRALVARALREVGRESEARELLGNGLLELAEVGPLEVERARAALAAGDAAAAVALLAAPVDGAEPVRRPEVSGAIALLAEALASSGQLERADSVARRAVELEPYTPGAARALAVRGRSAIARGEAEAAAELLREAGRVHGLALSRLAAELRVLRCPEALLPRLELIRVWLDAREPERALDAVSEALEHWPFDARLDHLRGAALEQLGRDDAALAAYHAAIARAPQLSVARVARARLRARLGETEAARRELESLLRTGAALDPACLEAHLVLARLLKGEGLEAAASERYAEYARLGGNEPLTVDGGD